jgi:hypothetical protein
VAKSDFIPNADHDLLVWLDRLIANLAPELAAYGLTEDDLAMLKAASTDFHVKIGQASEAAAAAKQATADKNDSRQRVEAGVRTTVRRIKAHAGYTAGQGAHLGIEGAERTLDLAIHKPDLSGVDLTGGTVVLSFTKYNSDGINLYGQRETDADWVLLGRATVSPFRDERPLLSTGKPELRRYTAVYMVKDREIGEFSDDLVINCAP